MLMYQKSMFDRYYMYCIKHLFFRSKTLEKLLEKLLFTCTYNGAEKHATCERFENAALLHKKLCRTLLRAMFKQHKSMY